ncbi:MAG TPA: hypothetical protein VKZ18_10290, partial [Polyangia bacterium]|nr:hypothetical protein [Polyangia bacterium]
MLTMLISFGTAGAATIQATSFSTTHAGTTADPWPGSAIQSAIASAQGGDVVVVADGIWSFTSALGNTNDGFTLKGQSLNAKLVFSGSGSYSLGSSSALSHDIKISSLTFDGSQISSWTNPVSIYNCVDCSFTGNTVLGTANTSLAALIFYGGAGNKIASNSIIAGSSASGGAQLQINPLASSMAIPINSGYDVDGNYFDSVNLLVIGISNLHVHGNTIVNKTLGNYVALFFTSQYGGITPPTRNITIDNNTLDGGSSNSVAITGLPQDPGGQGAIDGLVISGNVLRGTGVDLAINS